MQSQPLPATVTDPARLKALAEHHILDTTPEQGFDDVVELACRLCAVPVALVSLVTGDRQWFKARVNFPRCETDLNSSVCAYTLAEPDLLVIPDLSADPRTAENPFVTGEPHIRFYAGAPLRTAEGVTLGSLCVIDKVPRPDGLTETEAANLRALARQVMVQLDLRRALIQREESEAARREGEERLQVAIDAADLGTWNLDLLTDTSTSSPRHDEIFGYRELPAAWGEEVCGQHIVDADKPIFHAAFAQARETGMLSFIVRVKRPDNAVRWISAQGRTYYDTAGRPIRMAGVVADITDQKHAEEALRASEERLNLAFQASATIGWWDWDVPTDHLTTNAPFAALIGVEPERAANGIGVAKFWRAVHPDDAPTVRRLVDAVLAKSGPYLAEYRLVQSDGQVRWVLASGHCYHDPEGRPSRFPGILVDTTEATLAAQRQAALTTLGDRLRDLDTVDAIAATAAEITGLTLGLSRAGYCQVDAAEETVNVQQDWAMAGLASIAGLHHFRTYGSYIDQLKRGEAVLVRDVLTDPRTADTVSALSSVTARALFNLPIMERGRFVGLLFALCSQPRGWTDAEVVFLRGVADRTRAAIARVEAEQQQHLLNGELSHRLKNTLSMVLSIATQTLRNVPDRAPVENFEHRIHALASAHDVLLRQNRQAAPLHEVVTGVLKGVGAVERAEVSGPPVVLGSRASLSFALVLHELATNASKYGALSVPTGQVHLTWRIDGEGDATEAVVDWRETGGPPVVAPTRRGFGSRLIRLGLVGAGGVELRYLPEGFQAEMRAPLLQLQQS